ncbi:hypothetical protein NP493_283g03010 [Ridgeia piscesae]|uniref:Fibronectin type-III domain-containing protein n=1 Tax=Ridgeia piscesae TaxID=27915 RepID=A0AAD9NX37_RIDPI|nr:hypothetical protein NP493_283g03010 [Ridgeia piscesae]
MIGATQVSKMSLALVSTWLALTSLLTTATAEERRDTTARANDSFFIEVVHSHSSTSSIVIDWIVPQQYDVSEYVVEARRSGSKSVTRSMPLPGDSRTYEVTDLIFDADYEVCVYASLSNASMSHGQCTQLFTIPLIRTDNLLILFGVIAYIFLTFFVAYLCWRNAKKKFDAQLREEGTVANDHEEVDERIDHAQNTPMLLSVPGGNTRPRSIIEEAEENIPYIDEEHHAGSNNVK